MLEGVTRNVSGVTRAEHWDNYARIYMRGTNIAAFRNGMNVAMPWGPLTEDLSMVDRIEFVKGPAGFMLANGEPGGFYNVVTKKPTGVNRSAVDLSVGSFDTYRVTTDLDGVLNAERTLLYRFNVMGQLENSFVHNDFNNRYTFAPVVRYLINERTTATAEYTFQHSQMLAPGAGYQFSNIGFEDVPRSFTMADPAIDPTRINDHSAFLTLEHRITPDWQLTAQLAFLDYEMLGSSVWSASVAENGDAVRGLSGWDADNTNKLGQIFVNGELRTGAVGHRILAGLDLGNKSYMADFSQYHILGGSTPFNIYTPMYGLPADSLPAFDRSKSLRNRAAYIESQSYTAVYLQDEVRLLEDRLRLTLAGRFTSSTDDYRYGAAGINTGSENQVFTPRAGVSYSLGGRTSVYALYDRAYVLQLGADFEGNKFEPITGDNIEAGLKRDGRDGRWNGALTAFRTTKNNVLTADAAHPDFSIAIGQVRSQGVELDVRGELLPGLDATLNYAYTDSRVTDDADAGIVGNQTPGSTSYIINGWFSYRQGRGVLQGIGISLGYQWQLDRVAWFSFDGNEQELPNYFRLDAGLSWTSEQLSVSLLVNNLLDAYLFSGAYYPWGDFYFWVSEPPRHFRVNISYRF
jgi:iron complex outermembrane receptor protein